MKKYVFLVLKEKCYTMETYVMPKCNYYAGIASRAKISKLELFPRDKEKNFKNFYTTDFIFIHYTSNLR